MDEPASDEGDDSEDEGLEDDESNDDDDVDADSEPDTGMRLSVHVSQCHASVSPVLQYCNTIVPLTPTVAIWVPDRVKPVICNFRHPGTLTLSPEHQSARTSKITNDRLNSVWYRMLYSCTRVATVCDGD